MVLLVVDAQNGIVDERLYEFRLNCNPRFHTRYLG